MKTNKTEKPTHTPESVEKLRRDFALIMDATDRARTAKDKKFWRELEDLKYAELAEARADLRGTGDCAEEILPTMVKLCRLAAKANSLSFDNPEDAINFTPALAAWNNLEFRIKGATLGEADLTAPAVITSPACLPSASDSALIAAAPDLLAALKAAEYSSRYEGPTKEADRLAQEAADLRRAAIAKAEGR